MELLAFALRQMGLCLVIYRKVKKLQTALPKAAAKIGGS